MEQERQERGDPRLRTWVQAGIIAVFGLGAVQLYELTRPSASPVIYDEGSVVAAPELHSVLSDPSMGGSQSDISAGKLFKDEAGNRCRRFTQGYLSGTACMRQGDWRLVELKQADLPGID